MAAITRVRSVGRGVTGSPYYTNHYFTGEGLGADAIAAQQAVRTYWASLAPILGSALVVTIEGNVTTIEDTTGDITGVGSAADLTVTGSGGANVLPPQNQLRIGWRTGDYAAGRELQGASFIPYLGVGANNNGTVGASVNDEIAAAIAAMLDLGTFVVYSPTQGRSAVVTAGIPPIGFSVLKTRRRLS
uniref:Uncharacterized protein n=1 Tax=uncultured prokaryote TaxID=198431 RepID=A0A0H5Q5Z2_9ZZZZ|nr:hypothetical protein [uncultured prokaryote]